MISVAVRDIFVVHEAVRWIPLFGQRVFSNVLRVI